MKRNELGVPIRSYRWAENSDNQRLLHRLAHSHNKFVRAAVARNKHVSGVLLEMLLHDESPGVVAHALGNKNLTREQFESVFIRMSGAFCWVIHPVLAGHKLATIDELTILLDRNYWNIKIAILNNHFGRDQDAYKAMIKPIVPTSESEESILTWKEIDFLAYYRYYGVRKFT